VPVDCDAWGRRAEGGSTEQRHDEGSVDDECSCEGLEIRLGESRRMRVHHLGLEAAGCFLE
jgi:hypothetical protein